MADRRRRLGAQGEAAVAEWYEARGYRVVDRNWRCGDGELDLVLAAADSKHGGVVVFCEVKTRVGSAFGSPFEAVTPVKQRRLRRLAGRWLAEARPRSLPADRVRIDVASVRPGPDGFVIEVVEDAC